MKRTKEDKKLKKKSKATLAREREELTEEMRELRVRRLDMEEQRKILQKLYESALENHEDDNAQFYRTELADIEDALKDAHEEYKLKLELVDKIDSILKTRTERKCAIGKVAGLIGVAGVSLLFSYAAEENGNLVHKGAKALSERATGWLIGK